MKKYINYFIKFNIGIVIINIFISGLILITSGIEDKSFEEMDKDFNYMKFNEYESDLFVSGEINYSIGCFAEKELMVKSSTLVKSGGIYLVPIGLNENGNEKYIGVFISTLDFSTMDKITNSTIQWLSGKTKSMGDSPTLVVEGKLKKYTIEEERFMYEYMKSYLGTKSTAECDKYILPYYIDSEGTKNANIKLLIGVIFLIISTPIIIGKIKYFVEGKKSAKALMSYNPSNSYSLGYRDSISDYSDSSDNTYSYNQNNDYKEKNEKQTANDESAPTTTSKFKLKE